MRRDGQTVGCVCPGIAQVVPGDPNLRNGRTRQSRVPRNSSISCLRVTVPKSDTGRLPEYGKALGRTLVKELGNLAPYVRKKGCP